MRRAVLISREVAEGLRLSAGLAAAGDRVSAVLLDGATAIARSGHGDGAVLASAREAGVVVWAHDEALRRRAITEPAEGVRAVALDDVAELLAQGVDGVLWT